MAHAAEDGGEEEGEGVEGGEAAAVDDHVAVRLPVLEGGVDVALVKVLGGAALAVHDEAALDADAVVLVEEGCRLGPVKDHPPAEDTDEGGGETFDDEDPGPAGHAANTLHLGNGSGEETTEGAGEGGGREEERGAHTDLGTLVPAREVVVHTREETSLGDTEKPAGSKETCVVLAETHEGHDDTPDHDDASEEDTGCQSLQQSVGDGFSDGITNEEDGQGHVIVSIDHPQVKFHALQTSIANVCSIKEGEEVQQREPGDKPQVDFSHQPLVL